MSDELKAHLAPTLPAIVTDIEGTTTSIAFVKEVLFPFARKHLATFIETHRNEPSVIAQMAAVRNLLGNEHLPSEDVLKALLQWMDEDKKATPLKTLQGLIWENGYQTGELKSHVYEDAASALMRWHRAGHTIYVFSSGSIAAQKLLFAHTSFGDLTSLFAGYFDTTTGPKLEKDSYTKIAFLIGKAPENVVFLSDHIGELDAARAAGMKVFCLDRGESVVPHDTPHLRFTTFTDISF